MEYIVKTYLATGWTEETLRSGKLIKLVVVAPTSEECKTVAKVLAKRNGLDFISTT